MKSKRIFSFCLFVLLAWLISNAQSQSCQSNDDCPKGYYCAKEIGDCDGKGECTERPKTCPDIWDPVCGCDNQSYTNACEAAAAGVNIAYEGLCQIPCTTGRDCGENYFCYFVNCSDTEGFCAYRPEECEPIWDPVCGCDGVTYSNSCYAAMVGVSVDYRGECVPTSCTSNLDCGSSHYCRRENCSDLEGECEPIPLACPDVWAPVCGCDEITYGNACEAAMAGMSIAYEGECIIVPCSSNADCDSQHYCFKENCDDTEGVCRLRPVTCSRIWDPVCGCDGQTYANACEAARHGINVAYQGECLPPCTSNGDCDPDHYCYFENCQDPSGLCMPRPEVCPDIYDPVCGCDGITYDNDCYAAMAGISVAYDGPCEPRGPQPIMKEPWVISDDVHSGPSGVPQLRILWSEPVLFVPSDVVVANEEDEFLSITVLGNDSDIMTIRFNEPLIHDRYRINIRDTVVSALTGHAIDGDLDGIAGGKVGIAMEHRKRADMDNNNLVSLDDLVRFAEAWLWQP
ncbi:MAG: hypothetical protein JXA82_14140 [Sedimentisphaerales bacterium]|nr:hypothetical protein [Sedimentisphaerales bacterium]